MRWYATPSKVCFQKLLFIEPSKIRVSEDPTKFWIGRPPGCPHFCIFFRSRASATPAHDPDHVECMTMSEELTIYTCYIIVVYCGVEMIRMVLAKFHYADFPETSPRTGKFRGSRRNGIWAKVDVTGLSVADVTGSRDSGIWALWR